MNGRLPLRGEGLQSKDDSTIEPLISAEVIAGRVGAIAGAIEADFAGRRPLLVAVLLGAFVFASDLVRQMRGSVELTAVIMSSYPSGTHRAARPRLVADLRAEIENRDVIIIEDIVDSGRTMRALMDRLQRRGPASITAATLLDKPSAREIDVPLRYVGFEVPHRFVVGYGLDYAGLYRNLPYIGVLSEQQESSGGRESRKRGAG